MDFKISIIDDLTYYENDKGDDVAYSKRDNKFSFSEGGKGFRKFSEISEQEWEQMKKNFHFSHKLRLCEIVSDKYNGISISRDLKNWRKDGKLWGAYNRAIDIDLDEIEKEYQKMMREKKLKRILG